VSAAGRGPAAAIGATAGLVYLFFYLPVLVLVLFSFNEARTGGRWTGFTTAWYARLADNDQIRSATVNSILIAVIATALAVVVGTMLSLALDRHAFRGRRAAEQVVYLPVIAPEIVTGVSLLAFFSFVLSRLNDLLGRGAGDALRLGRPTVVIAHVAFCTAFVALVVRASLLNFDPVVEEAARDLGARRWTTFRRVTLPALASARLILATKRVNAMLVMRSRWRPGRRRLAGVGLAGPSVRAAGGD